MYVHGLGGASTNWTDLAALLSGELEGFAIDLPGFGHSDPAPRRGYTLPALSRRVARLIEHLGRGPVHLLGNSLGGAVTVHLAATRPDLVRTLTLISPAMPDLRPRGGSDPALALLLVPGFSTVVARRLARVDPRRRAEAVVELCFADPSVVPESRLAELAAELDRRNGVPWAMPAFSQTLRGLIGAYLLPGSRSLWTLAASIDAPTAVVWGREDRLVDASLAPRVARAIPDARLLVLDQVGHTAQLEAPEAVARVVLGLIAEARERAGPEVAEPAPTGTLRPG